MSPFDSAWNKWRWAVLHSHALEADVADFATNPDRQPVITTEAHYKPRRHAFAVVITSATSLPPDWSLMLGDVANNYRAALDHLAWALTERGKKPPATLPEGTRQRIGFPIARNNTAFNDSLPTKLPGVKRTDIAVVRRFQPYKRGQQRPTHCLSILERFNNLDKHRHTQPVYGLPMYAGYEITYQKDCIVRRQTLRGYAVPLEVDAEIGAIPVKKTGPDPQLKVKVEVTGEVTLENRVTVQQWLNKTRDWIGALLETFSEPPDWPD